MKLSRILPMLFLCSALAASVSAQKMTASSQSKTERAKRELTTTLLNMAKASLRGDAEFFRGVLADEYIATTVNGEVKSKAEVLEDYRKGDIQFKSHVFDRIQVLVYGDTAVVVNRAQANALYRGKPRRSVTRNTRTFVRRAGRWQCVAFQSTIVTPPK